MEDTLKQKIKELVQEEIEIEPYNPSWPLLFKKQKDFLEEVLPNDLIGKIEHFGSTAIPGLSAKPIIDILVEVNSFEDVKEKIVPVLESEGYEYFWRPTIGNEPPYYAWFIKRNSQGKRTHHIHMVEPDSELWVRLLFRDYLKDFPAEAKRYETLKKTLSKRYAHDRIEYTKQKSAYITNVTNKAIEYFNKKE